MSGFYGKSRGNLPVNIAEATAQSVPVQLQDQHTEILFRPFLRGLGQFTLTSPTVANNRVINVSPGHGIIVGDLIYIANTVNFTYSKVVAVNTNAISLSCPVDRVFTVSGTVCGKVTDEMAVDGSTTNLSYVLSIPIYAATTLDIKQHWI